MGRAARLGGDARAALRRGAADARRRRSTPHDDPADQLLRELGEELGVGDTYKKTPVGVFFGEPGQDRPRPVLRRRGPGPHRLPAVRALHGRLPARRQEHARQELPLARRAARRRRSMPERTVIDIRPLGAADGSDGYAVTSERSGALAAHASARTLTRPRRRRRRRPARHQQAAAALPPRRLAAAHLRTASASSCARTPRRSSRSRVPEDYPDDLTKRVAITSSIYPDPHTHIETVTYGDAGDSMRTLYTLLVGDGTRVTRPLKLLGADRPPPRQVRARCCGRSGWSRRTIIVLVMQTLDNAIALRPTQRRVRRRAAADRAGPRAPEPDVHPGRQRGRRVARQAHRRDRPELESSEALFNIPTTAHILGGAVIGARPERRRRRRPPARLRLREPARLRRRGGPGQRRRQPVADDHRAGRARDEPRAGPGRRRRSGRRVQLVDVVPVDDVPEGVEVVGAFVLVLQVVGVLPDVDAEQRRGAVGERRVLVRRSRRPRGRSRP